MYPHDSIFSFRTITSGLITLCVLFFILTLLQGSTAIIPNLGLVPALVTENPTTWIPFMTSMFLHGGFMHIFFNMYFLNMFGRPIESILGGPRYLALYIGAGLAAGLLQYITDPSSMVAIIGASGAISGIMGYYAIRFAHQEVVIYTLFFWGKRMKIIHYMLFWFGIQVLFSIGATAGSIGQGIAWWAHIGGFLFGVTWALLQQKQLFGK